MTKSSAVFSWLRLLVPALACVALVGMPARADNGDASLFVVFMGMLIHGSILPFRTRIRTHDTQFGPPERSVLRFVLFHPDFNRRLRNHTGSADLSDFAGKRSRAQAETLTAGGDFHPALRTLTGDIWRGGKGLSIGE